MLDFWQKQTLDKPLFDNLIWSRPENKASAGKLLIIGGHATGFSLPVSAYNEALKARAGSVRLLLPNSTAKVLSSFSSDLEFAESTTSGGFSQIAEAMLTDLSKWADGVLIAGDLGSNSETIAVTTNYISKSNQPICLINDSLDFCGDLVNSQAAANSVVVLDTEQLQKFVKQLNYPKPITHKTNLVNLAEALSEITKLKGLNLLVAHNNYLAAASNGNVSTTEYQISKGWANKLGVHAIIWVIQNPTKIFEALSCAAITAQE